MGLENEDFIGNPNKIEYTDDELEYEYYEAVDMDMADDLADHWLDDAGDEDEDDDDEDENWYDEVDEDDEGDSDFEVDDDVDNFLSESSDHEELRMTLVNGVLVPVSSGDMVFGQSSNWETEGPTDGNDIDNNEVVKSVPASTPSPENDAGDTGQNPPP